MKKAHLPFFISSLITLLLLITFHNCSAQKNTSITTTQYITDPQTLTSSGEIYKLGFFSPANSTNRYVGIWYNKIPIQTIVWVANRDNPLKDSSGVLRIANNGNLVVLDGRGVVLWTTNVSSITVKNSTSELLHSGNLVLQQASDRSIIWQSFEHPTDTILPTMMIGGSRRTGKKQQITSWKGESDPSTGSFSVGLELNEIPQIVIWNGRQRFWRSGPWNGRIFIGVNNMDSLNYLDGFYLTRNAQEDSVHLSFMFADNSSIMSRFVLDHHGVIFEQDSKEGGNGWLQTWSTKDNGECDVYGKCGLFGSCNKLNSPICSCLRGFKPKYEDEWSKGNWSGGCVRKTELRCGNSTTSTSSSNSNSSNEADWFLKLEMMKVPDFAYWLAVPDTNGLLDIQNFTPAGWVDLHIRLARSELAKYNPNHDQKKNLKVIIIITVLVGTFTITVCTYFFWRWMAKQRGKQKKDMEISLKTHNVNEESPDQNMLGDNPDLKIITFKELASATDNFSEANLLGQGGFGSVYKGKFMDGQEIAVKRLSKGSVQGLEEFKTEVLVILKLQHRNLVRLLGCCIEREEKMLIYEYMPNRSLDAFLFDLSQRALLDWKKRFQIIEGISRGILYLHRDSRLRVIHRDLKASNILLDEELNPKISDFGIARIFEGNELEANTTRVVGTYGYMSPEYAMDGLFSEKSDVFSFGVLLLEIVSGRRNTSFYNHELYLSLLGYAWELWNGDKKQLLIDPTLLPEQIFEEEIFRCIHVGLLCVQEFANDRPTMRTTLSMLISEIPTLPTPKQPAFTERQVSPQPNSSQRSQKSCSVNNVTITDVDGR
ncbi:Protein kinase domain [Macleaya cordata]|uniref:Receptor-like serine/threonine-protein kinase n=1 Tax=Macleaya cordata TaxID=56857 RepID=A0A200QE59_MACCD|nr:Protein kinase domain [Macleaya cordata]